MTISVLAEAGALSVARGVDFSLGRKGELRHVFVVYHTKSGCAFRGDWTSLEGATQAMNLYARIEANWDRPLSELMFDQHLRIQVEDVRKAIMKSDLVDQMAVEEGEDGLLGGG